MVASQGVSDLASAFIVASDHAVDGRFEVGQECFHVVPGVTCLHAVFSVIHVESPLGSRPRSQARFGASGRRFQVTGCLRFLRVPAGSRRSSRLVLPSRR